jgi:tetratricopeptide (TPR) repeat protein
VHLGLHSAELADVYNNIASVYHNQEDYDNALLYLLKALEIKKTLDAKDPDNIIGLVDVLNNLGRLMNDSKDFDRAEVFLNISWDWICRYQTVMKDPPLS